MYFVYVLRLNNGAFYKGRTDNLNRRLEEHLKGKTKLIRKYLPFELMRMELADGLSEAIRLENFFKSGMGREIIRELFS